MNSNHEYEVQTVLLCQRSDGLFLRLVEELHTTAHSYTDDPLKAKQIQPKGNMDIYHPNKPTYYFEPQRGAMWTKDCKMVAYEMVTVRTIRELE